MILKNGNVLIDGKLYSYDVRVENGLISDLRERGGFTGTTGPEKDLAEDLLFPGFIDTHIHGASGMLCGETEESMRVICGNLPRYGVTSFMPTPIADGSEASVRIIRNIRKAVGAPGADILGMFLYTPYKNRSIPFYAPPVLPTREHTLAIADGTLQGVRAILVAPELTGAMDWISWVSAQGILPVIGFTEGQPKHITKAVQRGACLTDHFPNGFPSIDHHQSQAVVQCLLENDLYLQLNADCIHVVPEYIQMMLRLKGADKILAVSDSSALVGCPEGEYMLGGMKVFLKDGAIRNSEGKLVTGAHSYDENMRTLYAKGFSLETIGRIFAENAAKAFHLADRGKIEPGRRADLVVLDKALFVKETIIQGKTAFRK